MAACVGASVAHGQDLTIKSAPQSQPIIIHNATIHTVSGPSLEDGAIAFENGRITAVMSAEEWKAASPHPGVKLIDANRAHVYPGLIGAYTQIGLTEFQAVRATIDMDEAASPISPEVRAASAVNPDSTLIPVTRSNGVLVVGVFPTGGVISGQVSAIRLEGWTTAEMTINPSLGIVVRWPNVRASSFRQDRSDEDRLREFGDALRTITNAFDAAEAYARARAADKNHPADLRWEAMTPLFPVERTHPAATALLLNSSRDAAPDPRARTFVFANDVDQITSAVAFAVSRGLRLVIVGGRDADLCADRAQAARRARHRAGHPPPAAS
jgi:Imidazolonepropionase and related amidohydrolases